MMVDGSRDQSLIKKVLMRVILLFLFLAGFSIVSAQSIDFNWPEDRLTAENKNTSYRIALEEGRYRDAANDLYWLLVNSPELSVSIYQNGTKIYEYLALNESNKENASTYVDSTLLLFDLRIKYYGEEIKVRNMKAYSAFKMLNSKKNAAKYLLQEYDSLYSHFEVSSFNVIPYAYVIRTYQKDSNLLSSQELMNRYNSIHEALLSLYGPVEDTEISKGVYPRIKVDDIFIDLLDADCDFIVQSSAALWEGRSDLNLSKVLFQRLNDSGCKDNSLYLLLAENIYKQDPQLSLSYAVLAKGYKEMGNYQKTEDYLKESFELTTEEEIKAKILIELAENSLDQNDKKGALDYLNQSIEIGSSKVAFNALGNLYYSSVEECNGINQRFMYILAYEMYEKAENDKMKVLSKEQFPSKEELFQLNLKAGELYLLDCMVKEEIILRTRD